MANNQNNDFKARFKKAADEADARRRAGQQSAPPQSPEQPPQQTRAPRDKTSWKAHFHFPSLLKWSFFGGAAGAALYTGGSLFQPAKKLFLVLPNLLSDNLPNNAKNKLAVFAVAGLQALGVVAAGYKGFNYALEETKSPNSYVTTLARTGVAGWAFHIVTRTAVLEQDRNNHFVEGLGNVIANSGRSVSDTSRDKLAEIGKIYEEKITESTQDESDAPLQTILPGGIVQICAEDLTEPKESKDFYGNVTTYRVTPEDIRKDQPKITAFFERMNEQKQSLLQDHFRDTYNTFKEGNHRIQIIVPNYKSGDNLIVKPGNGECPTKDGVEYTSAKYDSEAWSKTNWVLGGPQLKNDS